MSTIVVVGALLTAAGGIVAQVRPTLLLSASERMSAAADVYAGYLVSRNLALGIMLLATLLLRARRTLAGLMVLTALIQIIDAIVDAAGQRPTLVPGILVLGVAFLAGGARLSPGPLWRPESWRDPAGPEPELVAGSFGAGGNRRSNGGWAKGARIRSGERGGGPRGRCGRGRR